MAKKRINSNTVSRGVYITSNCTDKTLVDSIYQNYDTFVKSIDEQTNQFPNLVDKIAYFQKMVSDMVYLDDPKYHSSHSHYVNKDLYFIIKEILATEAVIIPSLRELMGSENLMMADLTETFSLFSISEQIDNMFNDIINQQRSNTNE